MKFFNGLESHNVVICFFRAEFWKSFIFVYDEVCSFDLFRILLIFMSYIDLVLVRYLFSSEKGDPRNRAKYQITTLRWPSHFLCSKCGPELIFLVSEQTSSRQLKTGRPIAEPK